METYEALVVYTEQNIELKTAKQLDKLYSTIEADENFILQWVKDEVKYSEVIIATNISSKVKNGELKLTARENKEEK